MSMTPIFAQAAAGGEPSALVSLLPLVLIFVIFWFLLIRPQQKKMKQHRAMVDALKRGDKVVTGGGIFGKVTKVVDETEVEVEIAENVRIRLLRQSVQEVLAKTQPASGKGDKETPAAANDGAVEKPANKSVLGSLFGKKDN